MTTDTKLTREQIELWRVVLGNRMGQADALCDMALRSLAVEQVPSASVVVPREIYQGALNYIQHVGANNVMRGELHPQQWLVDGLIAAAPTNAALQDTVGDKPDEAVAGRDKGKNPLTDSRSGTPAVAAPTDTPRVSAISTNLDAAKVMARILGTTIARCEEMLRAGNAAGLSTVYMLACVRAYSDTPSDSVVEALRWVLPLAKGYADAHPVGSNQEYVDDAVAVLAQADAARIGQLERELAEASRRIEELEFGPWKVK